LDESKIPVSVIHHLQKGDRGEIPETLKQSDVDKYQSPVRNHVIATAHRSLEAAADFCKQAGYQPIILGDTITGEARDVGLVHAAIARELTHHKEWAKPPLALISGGECTVTLPSGSKGRGGRCSEFLLSLFAASPDLKMMSALAADTDGIDGSEKNAGAWFTPDIREKANAMQLRASQFQNEHDCYDFFAKLDALVHTGPTLTNVNDFRIILIDQ
jgi:hydroxypyruvate reductase